MTAFGECLSSAKGAHLHTAGESVQLCLACVVRMAGQVNDRPAQCEHDTCLGKALKLRCPWMLPEFVVSVYLCRR